MERDVRPPSLISTQVQNHAQPGRSERSDSSASYKSPGAPASSPTSPVNGFNPMHDYSDRVRAIILAQPLNLINPLNFSVIPRVKS